MITRNLFRQRIIFRKRFGEFYDQHAHRLSDRRYCVIEWHFDPHKFWLGINWETEQWSIYNRWVRLDLHLCLIPCLPIYIRFWR